MSKFEPHHYQTGRAKCIRCLGPIESPRPGERAVDSALCRTCRALRFDCLDPAGDPDGRRQAHPVPCLPERERVTEMTSEMSVESDAPDDLLDRILHRTRRATGDTDIVWRVMENDWAHSEYCVCMFCGFRQQRAFSTAAMGRPMVPETVKCHECGATIGTGALSLCWLDDGPNRRYRLVNAAQPVREVIFPQQADLDTADLARKCLESMYEDGGD